MASQTKRNLDPLTKLENGNALKALLKLPLLGAVVIADIDRFKQINDSHGHAVGDAVIERCAQHLQQQRPWMARVFRVGGEEFAVFLPFRRLEAARDHAEVLRRGLLFARIACQVLDTSSHGARTPDFTISLGVSASGGRMIKGSRLFECADQALHAAKQNGKNRTEWRMPY